MKNKLILIIAIICVALIGYLLSLKNQKMAATQLPVAMDPAVPTTPAVAPSSLNNAPTTFPAADGQLAPSPAPVAGMAAPTTGAAPEVDGVPSGAPVAPTDAAAVTDQGAVPAGAAPMAAPAAGAAPAPMAAPSPATPSPAPAGVQQ